MKVVVDLPPVLYRELEDAAAMANCLGDNNQISPARFAREALESVLASRRLSKIELAKLQGMSA